MKVLALFYLLLFSYGCVKETMVKVDATSGIEFIEPKPCKMQEIKMIQFKTEIIDDKLVFDNENLGIFLQIINDYKLAVAEYKKCCNANENYYKDAIKEILK